jgi:hypothetical protein
MNLIELPANEEVDKRRHHQRNEKPKPSNSIEKVTKQQDDDVSEPGPTKNMIEYYNQGQENKQVVV